MSDYFFNVNSAIEEDAIIYKRKCVADVLEDFDQAWDKAVCR